MGWNNDLFGLHDKELMDELLEEIEEDPEKELNHLKQDLDRAKANNTLQYYVSAGVGYSNNAFERVSNYMAYMRSAGKDPLANKEFKAICIELADLNLEFSIKSSKLVDVGNHKTYFIKYSSMLGVPSFIKRAYDRIVNELEQKQEAILKSKKLIN